MVGMSTEHDFTIGSAQYHWLKADLAAVNRSVTPWIIFSGHRAMYINSDSNYDYRSDVPVMNNLIDHIEPLLFEYEVNFAFWGHNHAVQRMSAVYQKKVVQLSSSVDDGAGGLLHMYSNPQATVHYVMGTGGATLDYNALTPYPEWNEEVFQRWGYARAQALNDTVLDIEWVDSGDGVVYDHVVIIRSDPAEDWRSKNGDSDENGWNALGQATQIAIIVIGGVFISSAVAIAYRTFRNLKWKDKQQNKVPWTEIARSKQPQRDVALNPLV